MKNADRVRELYRLDLEGSTLIDEARTCGAMAAATITEALFLSTLEDDKLARPGKRRKIEAQVDKMSSWAHLFKKEVRQLVLPTVLKAALSFATD